MMFDVKKKIQKWQLDDSTFDSLDIISFKNYTCGTVSSYMMMYIMLLLSWVLLASDIYTCLEILVFKKWGSGDYQTYHYKIARWIFVGCILFQFGLMLYHLMWGINTYRSRNIALTYVNQVAKTLTSLNFYVHCIYAKIEHDSFMDWVAFLCYAEIDNAAQLLIADAPRQVVNIMTVRQYATNGNTSNDIFANIKNIADTNLRLSVILSFMCLSIVIWSIFIFRFIFAMLCYIPIKVKLKNRKFNSLKKYCCFVVNKKVKILVRKHNRDPTQRKHYIPIDVPTKGYGYDSDLSSDSYNLTKVSTKNTAPTHLTPSAGYLHGNTSQDTLKMDHKVSMADMTKSVRLSYQANKKDNQHNNYFSKQGFSNDQSLPPYRDTSGERRDLSSTPENPFKDPPSFGSKMSQTSSLNQYSKSSFSNSDNVITPSMNNSSSSLTYDSHSKPSKYVSNVDARTDSLTNGTSYDESTTITPYNNSNTFPSSIAKNSTFNSERDFENSYNSHDGSQLRNMDSFSTINSQPATKATGYSNYNYNDHGESNYQQKPYNDTYNNLNQSPYENDIFAKTTDPLSADTEMFDLPPHNIPQDDYYSEINNSDFDFPHHESISKVSSSLQIIDAYSNVPYPVKDYEDSDDDEEDEFTNAPFIDHAGVNGHFTQQFATDAMQSSTQEHETQYSISGYQLPEPSSEVRINDNPSNDDVRNLRENNHEIQSTDLMLQNHATTFSHSNELSVESIQTNQHNDTTLYNEVNIEHGNDEDFHGRDAFLHRARKSEDSSTNASDELKWA